MVSCTCFTSDPVPWCPLSHVAEHRCNALSANCRTKDQRFSSRQRCTTVYRSRHRCSQRPIHQTRTRGPPSRLKTLFYGDGGALSAIPECRERRPLFPPLSLRISSPSFATSMPLCCKRRQMDKMQAQLKRSQESMQHQEVRSQEIDQMLASVGGLRETEWSFSAVDFPPSSQDLGRRPKSEVIVPLTIGRLFGSLKSSGSDTAASQQRSAPCSITRGCDDGSAKPWQEAKTGDNVFLPTPEQWCLQDDEYQQSAVLANVVCGNYFNAASVRSVEMIPNIAPISVDVKDRNGGDTARIEFRAKAMCQQFSACFQG